MTIDGLSIANLGLFKPATPSEVAHQAEQSAQKQAEIIIKDVEQLDKVDPDGGKSKQDAKEGEQEDAEQQAQENTEFSADENLDLKKFMVKFNSTTNMVELIDRMSGEVIETISSNDLVNLMSKSKNPSGVLVDRKI